MQLARFPKRGSSPVHRPTDDRHCPAFVCRRRAPDERRGKMAWRARVLAQRRRATRKMGTSTRIGEEHDSKRFRPRYKVGARQQPGDHCWQRRLREEIADGAMPRGMQSVASLVGFMTGSIVAVFVPVIVSMRVVAPGNSCGLAAGFERRTTFAVVVKCRRQRIGEQITRQEQPRQCFAISGHQTAWDLPRETEDTSPTTRQPPLLAAKPAFPANPWKMVELLLHTNCNYQGSRCQSRSSRWSRATAILARYNSEMNSWREGSSVAHVVGKVIDFLVIVVPIALTIVVGIPFTLGLFLMIPGVVRATIVCSVVILAIIRWVNFRHTSPKSCKRQ